MPEVNPDAPHLILWSLGSDRKPLDEKVFHVALDYLAEHPEDTQWSRDCAALLASTDISSFPSAVTVFNTLLVKYPTLFPSVTVIVGDESRRIPKARLAKLSLKFAAQFRHEFKEGDTIKLDWHEEEAFAATPFLDYLASGLFEFDGDLGADKVVERDTVLALFTLAHRHMVSSLIEACLKFLEKELDADSLPIVLHHAADPHLPVLSILYPDLLWTCLKYTSTSDEFSMNASQGSPEATLLQYARLFRQNKISFSIVDGVRMVSIDPRLSPLRPEAFQALESLHNVCPITGLHVSHASQLDFLSFIKTLDVVIVMNTTATTPTAVPESWFSHAKHITCTGCNSRTILNALHATTASYTKSASIHTFNAPNAIHVSSADCASLALLDASKALYVYCDRCPSLTTLDFPSATRVSCTDCITLTSLNAPHAEEVDCSGCVKLQTLWVAEGCDIIGLPKGCIVVHVQGAL